MPIAFKAHLTGTGEPREPAEVSRKRLKAAFTEAFKAEAVRLRPALAGRIGWQDMQVFYFNGWNAERAAEHYVNTTGA